MFLIHERSEVQDSLTASSSSGGVGLVDLSSMVVYVWFRRYDNSTLHGAVTYAEPIRAKRDTDFIIVEI